VHFVGIDLSWGGRQPTGLAVLDESARLLHVSAVRTDDEIQAALASYVEGPCLVGIDAPLIVTNPTGSRPAEQALGRDFRRFDAGAHPSNTGKPEFSDGTRGARLCAALGLDMNPRSGRPRRAIEVYPHPATVVLFGLERTLKYKQKKGRDVTLLRDELLTLMTHVETLVTTGDAWALLRAQAESATRKSELRVVEDQVDAVVCAYIALFAERWPERTATYGDFETGYIVTPALPDGPHRPDAVHAAIQEYAAREPELVAAAQQFVTLVTTILDEAGINYLSVTGRTKGVASFAQKAGRMIDGRPAFPEPLRDITDQIGVRVITYVHSDVSAVADLLDDQVVVKDDRDMGQETASEGRFGYASRHLLITLDAARESDPTYADLRGRVAQVQVRTVLQHAWAEFEHDIRYKGTVPEEHARDLDRRFTLAAGLLELADQEFSAIRERLRSSARGPSEAAADDPRIDPRELAAYLAGQYADAGWSRTDHYAWISGLLLELGITSLDELAEVVRGSGGEDLNERMGYRYPPGAVRRLDDALLASYGESYVSLHGNAHRADALRARLEKLT
jgi:predicted RNase H-like nuclease/ppGpp synthetase/RelA/SpoT-type nucleotidyltranferase